VEEQLKPSLQSSVPEPSEKSKPEQDSPAEDRKSPREWAVELGNLKLRKLPAEVSGALTECYSGPHNSAAILHGWKQHAHHEGSPIQLTRAEYLAALEATQIAHEVVPGATGEERNAYRPHQAALSPHKSKRA
jgi:hypothetical protein